MSKKEDKELRSKYNLLHKVFEQLLTEQFVLSELRDLWRVRAGLKRKTKYSKEQREKYEI